jgi:HD-like signal output (HDOD) protein
VRGLLRQSWQHSVVVAAVCAAFARRDARVNPDTALLAGLMHGVGRLYILVQARGYAELLTAPQQLEQIVGSWHRMIGRKLLQQWQIPDAIVASVTDGDWWDGQQAADTVQLSAVVCLATLLVRHLQDPEALERVLTESGLLTQCSVTLADVLELPAASEPDIAEAIALLDAQLA